MQTHAWDSFLPPQTPPVQALAMGCSMAALCLSAVLLIAFTMQIFGVVSVPVTRKITISSLDGYTYGIWGFCRPNDGTCTPVGVGYTLTDNDNFPMLSKARTSLTRLLVVHVVSCGCTFILFLLSLGAFKSSKRYLTCMIIVTLPCFLVAILTFLVEVLIFVRHLNWPGWLTLGAVVCYGIALVLMCVRRRNISAKKALDKHADRSEYWDAGEPMSQRDGDELLKHQADTFRTVGTSDTSDDHPLNTSLYTRATPLDSTRMGTILANEGHNEEHNERRNERRNERHNRRRNGRRNGRTEIEQRTLPHRPCSLPRAPEPPELEAEVVSEEQEPPAVVAGTYIEGVEDPVEYGPNVVTIPAIRESRAPVRPERSISSESLTHEQRPPRAGAAPHATPVITQQPAREESHQAIMSYTEEELDHRPVFEQPRRDPRRWNAEARERYQERRQGRFHGTEEWYRECSQLPQELPEVPRERRRSERPIDRLEREQRQERERNRRGRSSNNGPGNAPYGPRRPRNQNPMEAKQVIGPRRQVNDPYAAARMPDPLTDITRCSSSIYAPTPPPPSTPPPVPQSPTPEGTITPEYLRYMPGSQRVYSPQRQGFI